MKRLAWLFLWAPLAAGAAVADVTVAPGVAVAEPDFLAVLESRVAEAGRAGLFREKAADVKTTFRRLATRPVDLKLAPAEAPRTVRKTLVAAQDLAAAGPAGDALKSLSRTYLFFDADDVRHRRWVRDELARNPRARPVAAAGDLAAASRRDAPASLVRHRLFADQGGVLARRLDVVAIPARAVLTGSAAGVTLTLDEIPVTAPSIQETTP